MTAAPPRPLRVVPDLLRRSAALVPPRPAVVLQDRAPLTFAELDARSNACAAGLRSRGVRRGDAVVLLHASAAWPDFAVAYFGVLKAGAVALLAGTRFTADDLRQMVREYQAVGGLAATGQPVPPLDCWVADTATVEAGQSTADSSVAAGPEDPAEVIFTSGTTARPRGVVATHANLMRAQPIWPTGVRANQPCAHALPLGSVAAQAVLLTCVGGQHTMLALAEFTVAGFADLVERHRASTVCLVPAMGHWLVRAAGDEIGALPSVRGVSFSGAALPVAIMPELAKIFPNAGLYNFYTSTEAYPARVATRFDPRQPESVGRPVGTSAVRIAGADGAELAPGEVGEVWLRAAGAPPRRLVDGGPAPAVRAGVQPDSHGWTRTGDLGYLDADGYLFLAGRTSDIVIVGGFNVSTARIEQVLARHEAVGEVAAFGVDHPVLGEIVAAFVVPRAEATVRELRQHAARHLSRQELPAIVRLVDDLPRNPAGKVVKRDLPALLDAPGAAEFVAPRSDLERAIAAVWGEVLDVGMVGAGDNFFDIGGDSLAATRIAAELRERLGVDLDTVAVFEAPTVAELAEHLRDSGAGGPDLADGVLDIVREVLGRDTIGPRDDLFEAGFDSLAIVKTAARVRERLGVDVPLAAYFDAGTPAELGAAIAAG
jgi:long-chain acyl-CoA synthetase